MGPQGASSPRLTTNGDSSSAPPVVRTNTRKAGLTSRTDTLIRR